MKKVMIVDDLQTEVSLMKSAVDSLGHLSVVANSGDAAIELAKREKPNLILLDIVLPGMDGFQVCRKLKKEADTAGIPVILVSSKNQDSDKFWGMKQGAVDYLIKPFQPQQLKDLVNRHIK